MISAGEPKQATASEAALKKLGLSQHEVGGVGDAENDHAFSACAHARPRGRSNALPAVKERAVDIVLTRDHAQDATELHRDHRTRDESRGLEDKVERHKLSRQASRWSRAADQSVRQRLLIAGPSGSGKSGPCTGLLERLASNAAVLHRDRKENTRRWKAAIVLSGPKQPPCCEAAAGGRIRSEK